MSIAEGAFPTSPNPSNIPLEDSQAYKDIISFVDSKFEFCKSLRLQFERQWYLNICFVFGKQDVQWASEVGTPVDRLMTPNAPKWRVRLIDNQIRRYLRKEYAKATKEFPTGYVLPASGDESDMAAAKAGDAILEYCIRESKARRELKRSVWWAEVCGTSFVKDLYKRQNAQVDPNTKEPVDTEGDIPYVEAVSPFHMFVPDIVSVDIEAQPYLFHSTGKSRQWVKNTYNVDVKAEQTFSSGLVEEKFLQAMGILEKKTDDMVYVKEGYFKPGGHYKDGAVVVWADNRILWFQEGWPFPYSDYPFAKIDHVPTGRFYAESAVTDAIPVQKEYNRTRSQIIENKNLTARPQYRAPLGSVDTNKITSEPGLVIEYKPGFDPIEPIPINPLPSYVMQEVDRNIQSMDDIFSQHEVSRGGAPPGVEAATAISYLQEEDDSVLADLIAHIEEAVEKIGRHYLANVNVYWSAPRKIQVVGLNNQLEAYEFSKDDLRSNTTYVVQAGSAVPTSRAAKQAFIISMVDKGQIPPAQGLKYLDMGMTSKLFEEMQIDSRQAQRENLKMQQGVGLPQLPQQDPMNPTAPIGMGQDPNQDQMMIQVMSDPSFTGFPVNTWDNDVVHITEHDNWRKRQEYEAAPPPIKMLFELHDRLHKRRLIILHGGMPINTGDPAVDDMMLNAQAYRILNGIPLEQAPGGGNENSSEPQ